MNRYICFDFSSYLSSYWKWEKKVKDAIFKNLFMNGRHDPISQRMEGDSVGFVVEAEPGPWRFIIVDDVAESE